MTMDNLQRTEHFLSYCPQLINVTETLPHKEATKRLSKFTSITAAFRYCLNLCFFKGNQSKTFMSNNLNKMSIKDYFKHLYDEIMKTRVDKSTTILSRIPSLIIHNNKSIGVYEDQNYDLERISGK